MQPPLIGPKCCQMNSNLFDLIWTIKSSQINLIWFEWQNCNLNNSSQWWCWWGHWEGGGWRQVQGQDQGERGWDGGVDQEHLGGDEQKPHDKTDQREQGEGKIKKIKINRIDLKSN